MSQDPFFVARCLLMMKTLRFSKILELVLNFEPNTHMTNALMWNAYSSWDGNELEIICLESLQFEIK